MMRRTQKQNTRPFRRLLTATVAALAALAALLAALSSGCSHEKPVSGSTASPTPRPTPTVSAATAQPSAQPTAEPSAAPTDPPGFSFPLQSAALFFPGAIPGDFQSPVYLGEGGAMFLYCTRNNTVVKAQWNGSGFSAQPVVEGVTADATAGAFVDKKESMLFCRGEQLLSSGTTGPAIVMVNLKNGARCNIDDYVGWREKGSILSGQFQYSGNHILAQVLDAGGGSLLSTSRWVVVDVATKTYHIIDMGGFASQHLKDWQSVVSERLALTGDGRLIAIDLMRNTASPAATDVGGRYTFGCYITPLNLSGQPLSDSVSVSGSGKPESLAIGSAELFRASADGRYLLYSGRQPSSGLYLLDLSQGREYTVLPQGKQIRSFAQWGSGDTFYYGTWDTPEGDNLMVYKTSVDEIMHPE